MIGDVPGLQPGDNLIQVFDSKTSKVVQAQIRISKALVPQITCTAMAGQTATTATATTATAKARLG
jgi:hypothetical protein